MFCVSYQEAVPTSPPHLPVGEYVTKAQAEAYWWLFQALPARKNRLQQTRAAFHRLTQRRKSSIVPPRPAFNTTVDYYEALVPLFLAQSRFNTMINQSDLSLRLLRRMSAQLLPNRLF